MASWFYVRNNQQVGPVTLEQLQAMAQRGELRQEDKVWGEGMPDWVAAGSVQELRPAAVSIPVATDAAPASASPSVWYYARDNQQSGPITLEQLQAMVRTGQLRSVDRVWADGMKDWVEVSSVPQLQGGAAQISAPAQSYDGTLSYRGSAPSQGFGQYPTPTVRAKWSIIFLWCYIGSLAATIALNLIAFLLINPRAGGLVPPSERNVLIIFGLGVCGILFLQIGTRITCAVLIAMWSHRANRAARYLGTPGMTYTPGWAAGWYFVPFANLVMPFLVVTELWKASTLDIRSIGDLRTAQSSTFIGLWWGFWITGNLVNAAGAIFNVVANINKTPMIGITTIIQGFGWVLLIFASIFLIKVVGDVTSRLEQRAQKMGVALPA